MSTKRAKRVDVERLDDGLDDFQSNRLNGDGDELSKSLLGEEKTAQAEPQGGQRELHVQAPNMQIVTFTIVGTSPYVQNKFSNKAKEIMRAAQEAGSQSKKGKAKPPKDFDAAFEDATYKSKQGWFGIPATAFRNGLIDACRLVGFKMTHAKLSVFCVADGYDHECHAPLVRITKGDRIPSVLPARNASGTCDLRSRPMWEEGWEADVTLRYDGDQFSADDVANLLMRVGMQVGIGEGRAFSKNSHGLGWGHFMIKPDAVQQP